MPTVWEMVVRRTTTLVLALCRDGHKPAHHAKLGPMYSCWVVFFEVPVVFLRLDHIGDVHLPRDK